VKSTSLIVAFALAASGAARAEDFYAGKTITISVHVGVGGTYDSYIRLLSRHFGRHVPGNPNVVVVNQLGAGGLLSFNHMARVAPQDGTWLAQVTQSLILHELTSQPGMRASLGEVKWIGNLSQSNNVAMVWPTSKVRTIAQARDSEFRVGATGVGATSAQLPALYNYLLGTKFKLIIGYKSSAEMDLACERGELDGRTVTAWPTFVAGLPRATAEKVDALVQVGARKDAALAHVPLLSDLVRGDAAKEAISDFMTVNWAMTRPIAAGPGVPDDRVQMLRRAFDATMKDRAFLDEAEKMAAEIDPMTGEEAQLAVAKALATPKPLIARVQGVLDSIGK
jgi:tripartite-type tricarboxylate transporter receptor subunit TctC